MTYLGTDCQIAGILQTLRNSQANREGKTTCHKATTFLKSRIIFKLSGKEDLIRVGLHHIVLNKKDQRFTWNSLLDIATPLSDTSPRVGPRVLWEITSKRAFFPLPANHNYLLDKIESISGPRKRIYKRINVRWNWVFEVFQATIQSKDDCELSPVNFEWDILQIVIHLEAIIWFLKKATKKQRYPFKPVWNRRHLKVWVETHCW